jgi:DNA mismatch endonuclease, patch repair protein
MSDNLKPDDRKRTMQAVKSKGTKLERRLFAMLAGMGLNGWKKNDKSIIGKPDVAFPNQHIVIFVDGCFWHSCPFCNRKLPETNRAYWEKKIKRNVELAELYNEQLRNDGWIVLRFWEHEIADSAKIKASILLVLDEKGLQSGRLQKRKLSDS